MADAKSKFKRPEQPTGPVPDADAERFVRGANAAPTKSEAMKRLTIDIPESLHKRVKSQCAAQGTTIADVIRHFLELQFSEPKGR